jgi:hypothetical protein
MKIQFRQYAALRMELTGNPFDCSFVDDECQSSLKESNASEFTIHHTFFIGD